MERIKLALERARQTRNGAAPPQLAQVDDRGHNSGPPEEIRYTSTRTFEPDRKLLRRNRVLLDDTESSASAAFKVLRTQVLQRMSANDWTALAISSPGQDEGKSLVSVNLAISIALEANHTVLLADLDLRRPGVHTYFGYEPEFGLSDHLLHDVPMSQILFNPGIDGLVVLPGRERLPNSSEALSSRKMVKLVSELKSRYPNRMVLFDLPPLLSADDALAFSPYVDAALLVLRDGHTSRDHVLRSVGYLESTHLLGTVLNHSDEFVTPAYY
ncbi:MAG: CpsD/CapB family tyrosine-protein kinase [Gammaproteobacteria bacterium]